MNNITVRTISGFFYILILFLGTTNYGSYLIAYLSGYDKFIFQGTIFYLLILLLFIGTFFETAWFIEYENKFFILISFLFSLLPFYYFSKYYFSESFYFSTLPIEIFKNSLYVLLFSIALITIFRFPEEISFDTSKLIFLCAYISIPFSLALILPNVNQNENIFSNHIFFIFLLIWLSDTFAYLTGKFFGKRPLAPLISPKKTIEGLIGGIICTLLVGIVIELNKSEDLNGNWIVLSIIISIAAPIGDLAASKLKRTFGVKDSGILIPGHGGLLDRLDSFIACIPFVFLYYIFY